MENLVFGEWIELDKGLFAKLILQNVQGIKDTALITLSFSDETLSEKKLLVKGRQVFDGGGKILDFGTAYPIATEYGKRAITKAFVSAWM